MRSREAESNRERVDHLCRLDQLEIGRREHRRRLWIFGAPEGELDIVRGHRYAIVPAHIAVQAEGDPARLQIPALGQVGPRLERLVVLHQRGEQHVVDHLVGVLVGVHQGIESTHVGVESDDRGPAYLGIGRGDVGAGPLTAAAEGQRQQAAEDRTPRA